MFLLFCLVHTEIPCTITETCKKEDCSDKLENSADCKTITIFYQNGTFSTKFILENIRFLANLRISQSNIPTISETFLNGFERIENLSLINNQIKKIEKNAFDSFINLKQLKIGANQIQNINESFLKNLSSLKEFYARRNQITFLHHAAFTKNQKLNIINLAENKIRSLDENIFKGLEELKDLNVSYNQLTVVKLSLFQDNKSLKIVDLSHNQIIKIKWIAVAYLVKLESFNLSDNTCINITFHYGTIFEYRMQFDNCSNESKRDLIGNHDKNQNEIFKVVSLIQALLIIDLICALFLTLYFYFKHTS